MTDSSAGFKDLVRFKAALKPKKAVNIAPVTISSNKDFETITIYPDNRKLYVHVEKSNQNSTDVVVTFYGLGGSARVIYTTNERGFIVSLPPHARDSIHPKDIERCQLVLDFAITIKSGPVMELSQLTKKLMGNESFNRTVETVLKPIEEEEKVDGLTSQLAQVFKNIEAKNTSPDHLVISTDKLWKAVSGD